MANFLGPSPEERPEGRQVVLYGPPFVGKTSSLADPDLKVLLCDMDHNTSPLDNADNVTVYPIDHFDTDKDDTKRLGYDNSYMEFKRSIERGYFVIKGEKVPVPKVDVVAFDGFTRFEELVKYWVANVFAPNRSREIQGKFGAQTDWDDLQRTEVEEIRDWQSMTRTKGFCSIWMGHDMAINSEITKKAARIQLALQGKYAGPRIMSAVDAVFYMDKVLDPKDKDKKTFVRGVYTQQFDIIQADARMPIEKREKLPKFIPTVQWSKILPYIGYRKVEESAITPDSQN